MLAIIMVLSLATAVTFAEEDYEVDLSTLAGAAANYAPHGYPDRTLVMFGYGTVVSLGTIDLSKYSACEITYATDLGYKAFIEGMTATAMWALKSNNASIGFVNDGPHEEGLLASGELVDADKNNPHNPDGANWDKDERTAVIDLSNVDYNGEVWLSHFNSTGNEGLCVAIKFVGKEDAPQTETGVLDFKDANSTQIGMSLDAILWNGNSVGNREAADAYVGEDGTLDVEALNGENIGFNGWVCFKQEVKRFGYMINDEVVFDDSFWENNEDGLVDVIRGWGGDWANGYPQRFKITVPFEGLSGNNVICAVVELADGKVVKMNDDTPGDNRDTTFTLKFPQAQQVQTGDVEVAMFAVLLVVAMGAVVVFSKKRAF